MNWNELTGEKGVLLTHWQKVSQFSGHHPAIGSGIQKLSNTLINMPLSVRIQQIK